MENGYMKLHVWYLSFHLFHIPSILFPLLPYKMKMQWYLSWGICIVQSKILAQTILIQEKCASNETVRSDREERGGGCIEETYNNR